MAFALRSSAAHHQSAWHDGESRKYCGVSSAAQISLMAAMAAGGGGGVKISA